jgi:hypothetical protein
MGTKLPRSVLPLESSLAQGGIGLAVSASEAHVALSWNRAAVSLLA